MDALTKILFILFLVFQLGTLTLFTWILFDLCISHSGKSAEFLEKLWAKLDHFYTGLRDYLAMLIL